jgi:hypothetical protein
MGEGCLQPEDIPRNRIYAVAAAQGFLLDFYGIDWKGLAQQAGPEFTYVDLLSTHLGTDENVLTEHLDRAKREYDYEAILACTMEAADKYERAFAHALKAFEEQDGIRLELAVASSGLSRSRVSRSKKWLMENGRFLLCSNFKVYTLRSVDWSFELHDAGLLEINDWDAQRKTIVVYDTGTDSVSFDGELPIALAPGVRAFESFDLAGDQFTLGGKHPGRFVATGSDRFLPPGTNPGGFVAKGDTIRFLLEPDAAEPNSKR